MFDDDFGHRLCLITGRGSIGIRGTRSLSTAISAHRLWSILLYSRLVGHHHSILVLLPLGIMLYTLVSLLRLLA